eukprot:GHVP01059368.1.p1 GENE.GHVP01059368.1~~GHVP01059368.1.p1  ORF type:complete len:409 (+),score=56.52 GHVP01059368.1:29-1255(+)
MSSHAYILSKRPAIIQIGSAYTRAGLAGEIIPKVLETPFNKLFKQELTFQETNVSVDWTEEIEVLLRNIYFSSLNIVPSTRRLILVEGPFLPVNLRKAIISVALLQLHVPSVTLCCEIVSPLHLTSPMNITTGLIIDCGESETRIVPVIHGAPFFLNGKILSVGAKEVYLSLGRSLKKGSEAPQQQETTSLKSLQEHNLTNEELRAIMMGACYARYSDSKSENTLQSTQPIDFSLKKNVQLRIDPQILWSCTEILFNSFGFSVASCIESCPLQERGKLVQNIVFVGGGAEILGYRERALIEIRTAFEESDILKAVALYIMPANSIFPPSAIQWVGASLVCSAASASQIKAPEISKENFSQKDCLPDWTAKPSSGYFAVPEVGVVSEGPSNPSETPNNMPDAITQEQNS